MGDRAPPLAHAGPEALVPVLAQKRHSAHLERLGQRERRQGAARCVPLDPRVGREAGHPDRPRHRRLVRSCLRFVFEAHVCWAPSIIWGRTHGGA